jgi:hypothetical protein
MMRQSPPSIEQGLSQVLSNRKCPVTCIQLERPRRLFQGLRRRVDQQCDAIFTLWPVGVALEPCSALVGDEIGIGWLDHRARYFAHSLNQLFVNVLTHPLIVGRVAAIDLPITELKAAGPGLVTIVASQRAKMEGRDQMGYDNKTPFKIHCAKGPVVEPLAPPSHGVIAAHQNVRVGKDPPGMCGQANGNGLSGHDLRQEGHVFRANPIRPDRAGRGIGHPNDSIRLQKALVGKARRNKAAWWRVAPGKPAQRVHDQWAAYVRSDQTRRYEIIWLFVQQAVIAVGRMAVWGHWRTHPFTVNLLSANALEGQITGRIS